MESLSVLILTDRAFHFFIAFNLARPKHVGSLTGKERLLHERREDFID